MSADGSDANPFGDWAAASGEFYRQWERGMTAWWDRVLDSPQVLSAMNKTLASQVDARRRARDVSSGWMARMNLPSRADFTRLLKVATLLEEKLLSLEDRLLALGDGVGEARKEALRGRIDAAEARVDLGEQLSALQARLEAIEARLAQMDEDAP